MGPSPQGDKPRHPNQYTYRNAGAGGEQRPKQPNQYSKQGAVAVAQSPKQSSKHPNQYTYRQPNQHTVKLTSSGDRPKQPNQYTYAKKAAPEKLLGSKRHANQYTKSAERRAGGSGKTADGHGAAYALEDEGAGAGKKTSTAGTAGAPLSLAQRVLAGKSNPAPAAWAEGGSGVRRVAHRVRVCVCVCRGEGG